MDHKVDVPSTTGVLDFDKQELKEVGEREANGEISGCDGVAPGGGESEENEGISNVAVISISSDVEKLEERFKEEVVLSDKQEIKEDEEREANNRNEVSSILEEDQHQSQQEEKQVLVSKALLSLKWQQMKKRIRAVRVVRSLVEMSDWTVDFTMCSSAWPYTGVYGSYMIIVVVIWMSQDLQGELMPHKLQ